MTDEAMLHAFDHPAIVATHSDGMTVFVGPDHSGTLVEVGVADTDLGPMIIHAMRPARPKYTR